MCIYLFILSFIKFDPFSKFLNKKPNCPKITAKMKDLITTVIEFFEFCFIIISAFLIKRQHKCYIFKLLFILLFIFIHSITWVSFLHRRDNVLTQERCRTLMWHQKVGGLGQYAFVPIRLFRDTWVANWICIAIFIYCDSRGIAIL